MASRNPNSGWSRGWAAFFAIVIILGGVAVSLGFGVRLRSALERNADNRMATASTTLETTVTEQLARYVDTVRLTAAALASLETPTAQTFADITKAVAGQQLTAASGIRFVVPADPDGVDEVAPRWRERGAQNLKIGKVADVQQHLFTVFARGLNGAKAPPIGADQGVQPAAVEVARLARTSNGVAVSDAYGGDDKLSFDVVAPVTGADNRPAGYVMLSVAGAEFVSTLLTRAAGDLLDAQLLTRSGSGELTEVASVLHAGRTADVRRAQNFEAGQRQWVLRTSADRDVLLPATGRTDMVIVLAGSVLAVMFGSLLYLQMSAAKRIEQEIQDEVEERLATHPPTLPAADTPAGKTAANPGESLATAESAATAEDERPTTTKNAATTEDERQAAAKNAATTDGERQAAADENRAAAGRSEEKVGKKPARTSKNTAAAGKATARTGDPAATTVENPAITGNAAATEDKTPATAGKDPAATGKDSATAGEGAATTGKESATAAEDATTTGKDPATAAEDATSAGEDATRRSRTRQRQVRTRQR